MEIKRERRERREGEGEGEGEGEEIAGSKDITQRDELFTAYCSLLTFYDLTNRLLSPDS